MADSGVRRRAEFWPVVVLSSALVLVLAGWAGVTYLDRTRSDPACVQRTSLRIAVAPSVAEPAQEVGRRLAARDRCLDIAVDARESAEVLRQLAGTAPAAVGTPGAEPSRSASDSPATSPSGTAPQGALPDVWLPESTLWLRRARAAGAYQVPEAGVSVASTPVVLALDERSARRLGWPGRALDWKTLVAAERPPVPVVSCRRPGWRPP
ncbi:substrate-binding domain-containing protein [Asanoa sp. NPDC050611]|uniref:substrate-binding domain-containing protein n=1 Tax=Asanoa sp. NPDC050611 TaxID=3157098 RepID=UPI0033F09D21